VPSVFKIYFYYITDRSGFPGDERTRRLRLLDKIAEASSHGVDYIQLREKDLPARELERLARDAMSIIREAAAIDRDRQCALLINSRTDVALAADANGVHLQVDDVSPEEVRFAWSRGKSGAGACFDEIRAGSARKESTPDPLIAVSCHSLREVTQAAANLATFAVFAPVFGKKNSPATRAAGLDALREASLAKIPVLALGGVSLQNADSCLRAGAAGIAAIRLFQENDISTIVEQLRG
jgi:thiamine-phosphate pyrophosphorylase